MIGAPLHIDQPFARAGTQDLYQCDKCDLGRVASSVKHRLPRKQSTHFDAVQAANKFTVLPHFDRMRVAASVQFCVSVDEFFGDPAMWSVRVRA